MNLIIKKYFPITVILILGILLRLFHFGVHSLWLDEIGQVITATYSLKDMFGMIANHLSPPLDYIVIKFILMFGSSEFILRLPAMVVGVLSILFMYLWVRQLLDEKVALLGAMLLAVSPMAIAFSQEVRMYSLFLMLALLSYWLLTRFYEKSLWINAIVLGLVNGLLILTHYFGLFLVITQAVILIVLFIIQKRTVKDFCKLASIYLFNIIVFLPWLPYLLQQIQNSGGEMWYAMKPKAEFFKLVFISFSSDTGSRDIWFTLFFSAFIYSLWRAFRQKKYEVIISGGVMVAIIFGLFLISFYKQFVTPRNLIFLLPLFYLSIAYIIDDISKKVKCSNWLVLVVVVLIMSWPVYNYHCNGRPDYKPNYKAATKYIQKNIEENEHIVTTDVHNRGCVAYYIDPKADNVFMKSKWTDPINKEEWLVWKADQNIIGQIRDHKWKGWVVLPPNSLHAKEIEDSLREILKRPTISFKTQGKGRDLEVYHLK